MINRETLLKKIESLPPYLLEEVEDYIEEFGNNSEKEI